MVPGSWTPLGNTELGGQPLACLGPRPTHLGRAGGRREVSRLGPTLTVSDAPAACSLWSLAGASGGAVMVVQAFQAQGAAGPAASGVGGSPDPVSAGASLCTGPTAARQVHTGDVAKMYSVIPRALNDWGLMDIPTVGLATLGSGGRGLFSLLTGALGVLLRAPLDVCTARAHRGAAPWPCLRAADKMGDGKPWGWARNFCSVPRGCAHQQKGWKSVNVAQPFSSGAEALGVPAAHTLEPTSITTPGAGTAVFTGSSDNPHTASAGWRHQLRPWT